MAYNWQPQPRWSSASSIRSQVVPNLWTKIMQVKLGSCPVVVASSPEMAKQFLKTHDHIFASRPQTAAGKYLNYGYLNVTYAPTTQQWYKSNTLNSTCVVISILHWHEYIPGLCRATGSWVQGQGVE
ncbi:hypothetical protein L3X38_039783 [Prunus dulcis]|uniref:Uncharacterized protein n=1 Tax=Prunus dulcis TaxID=3755 RepID=A0AAD4V7S9_PRUDU|nr:hypothetical protein L3X38_039783 [Prunus dulcis]